MSLTLGYDHDSKILYSDNTLVGKTKWGAYFLSIFITERGASLTRYVVPGRIDTYCFDWVPGGTGIGNRTTFFTDTGISLESALKFVKKDLKKLRVKELLKEAKANCKCSYLDSLLNSLR
jgi:hypothetical protein